MMNRPGFCAALFLVERQDSGRESARWRFAYGNLGKSVDDRNELHRRLRKITLRIAGIGLDPVAGNIEAQDGLVGRNARSAAHCRRTPDGET